MSVEAPLRRPAGRPRSADALPADAILDVALRAFATHGYEGVSVRTLNRELGVSHNLINQRFGTKDELWRAAVDRGFGELTEYIDRPLEDAPEGPLDLLEVGIRRFLRFSADHPEALGLMNIEGRQESERLDYIFENYVEPSISRIGAALDALAAEGLIRPIPIRTFHFLITHGGAAPFTLSGLAGKLGPDSPMTDEAKDAHTRFVSELIVDGLRLDGGRRAAP